MIEIDSLPRLSLSDINALFEGVIKLRKATRVHGKENLECPASSSLHMNCKLYSARWEHKITYHITAELNNDIQMEIVSLLIEWRGRDYKSKSIRVFLTARKNNLGRGRVKYLVCPYTGKLCRNLYTDGNLIITRHAVKHTYSDRNLPKRMRGVRYGYVGVKEPYRKYGKETYRGKSTPYGKRVAKFEKNREIANCKFLDYAFNLIKSAMKAREKQRQNARVCT